MFPKCSSTGQSVDYISHNPVLIYSPQRFSENPQLQLRRFRTSGVWPADATVATNTLPPSEPHITVFYNHLEPVMKCTFFHKS